LEFDRHCTSIARGDPFPSGLVAQRWRVLAQPREILDYARTRTTEIGPTRGGVGSEAYSPTAQIPDMTSTLALVIELGHTHGAVAFTLWCRRCHQAEPTVRIGGLGWVTSLGVV
jgi:hypothetical protein